MKGSAHIALLLTMTMTMTLTVLSVFPDRARAEAPHVTDEKTSAGEWQLVWQDEFDKEVINANNWTLEVNCAGGGNNEKQCYTDNEENAYVADGKLIIVALPARKGAEKPYTSARLNSRGKADFRYGRIEIRAKLPFGQGSWPALWMMPTEEVYGSWPKSGEIDIMEAVNLKTRDKQGKQESRIHGTLHYGGDWPDNVYSGQAYALPDEQNPADDFHTYSIEWQQGEIRWYVDNHLYAAQRQSVFSDDHQGQAVELLHRGWFTESVKTASNDMAAAPFDQKFYVILNLAVGGNWPENTNQKGIDEQAFALGQHMQIDFVRVYQCAVDPVTGKGCNTSSSEHVLIEGRAK